MIFAIGIVVGVLVLSNVIMVRWLHVNKHPDWEDEYMPLFDYVCDEGHLIADQYNPIHEPVAVIPCTICGGLARKILHFPAIKRSMPAHFNSATGEYVENERGFRDALHRKSEAMSARTGLSIDYRPLDYRDTEDCGVTEEGLDATRRQATSTGQREGKKFL